MKAIKTAWMSFTALFLSVGTLLCCVLPIVLVSLGFGAGLAALIGAFPVIATLSQYKAWLFLVSALFLVVTAYLIWRPDRTCPTEPTLARRCHQFYTWSQRIFWVAFILWIIGTTVTYVLLPIII